MTHLDAAVEFGLQPGLIGLQQFMQGQFNQLGQQFNQLGQQVNARFDQQQAMIFNNRIVSRNRRDIHSPHRPLQKYVSLWIISHSAGCISPLWSDSR